MPMGKGLDQTPLVNGSQRAEICLVTAMRFS